MASEAHRQITRVVSNYLRLGLTFLIGIILTRVQFAWLGADGFGLIALLVATMGLSSMFSDLARQSLVRELARWHATDRERFLGAYHASFALSAAMALLTVAVFVIVYAIIPALRIDPEMVGAARAFLLARGAWQTIVALFRPIATMYIVREDFRTFNLFTIALRANELIGASVLFYLFGIDEPARAIVFYGVVPAGLNVLILAVLTFRLIWIDRGLIPAPHRIRRDTVREIAGTFGWNSGVILAATMHDRVASIIMNVAFGVWGNVVFGLAFRLVAYARMASIGMIFGVDASSARLTETGRAGQMRALLRHATRGQAVVVAPLSVIIIALAPELLTIWVGAHIENPEHVLGPAATLARILMVGIAARAISDGWLRILYGAGHVRAYAKMILLGGLLSPPLTILLLLALPDGWSFTAVGWSYTVLMIAFHCVAAPALGAQQLGVPLRAFYAPLTAPILTAVLPAPLLLLLPWFTTLTGHDGLAILLTVGAYGGACAVLILLLVLTRSERARLAGLLWRRRRTTVDR